MTIFLRITGPIALPGILACGIFTFINSWDEFLLARTMITSEENWILPIGLHSLFGTNFTRWELTTATAVIYAIPPLVLFLAVQRYFVAGLSGGAVKG